MHIPEESESGVVPMSHSNNDGQLSAESGEGRLLIKENVRQPDTLSTERGWRVTRVGGRAEGSTGKDPRFDSPLFIRDRQSRDLPSGKKPDTAL